MNSSLQEIVVSVVATNFEELAFMFGEQVEMEELPELEGPAEAVQMKFSGHFPGVLSMAVPDELTIELAGNMLGMDEDEEQVVEAAHDSLKEMLNVICGHILTEVAGTEVVFDLSVPHVARLSDAQWKAMIKSPNTVHFELEDQPLLVNVKLDTDLEALLD